MLLKSCKSAKIEVTTNNKQQTFLQEGNAMNVLASTVIALSLFSPSNTTTPHNEIHVYESGVVFTVHGSSGSLAGVTV